MCLSVYGVCESNISLFVSLCISGSVCLPACSSICWLVSRVKVDRLVSLYCRMLVARSVILSTQTANKGRPD